jgi:hypothetical protein
MLRSVQARYAEGARAASSTPKTANFLSMHPEFNSKYAPNQLGIHLGERVF